MKTFALALGALTFATVAHAADVSAHERPDPISNNFVAAARTVEAPAGRLLASKELQRADLKATDLVTVTLVGNGATAQEVQRSTRGDN